LAGTESQFGDVPGRVHAAVTEKPSAHVSAVIVGTGLARAATRGLSDLKATANARTVAA
jgi:hypothetical protein